MPAHSRPPDVPLVRVLQRALPLLLKNPQIIVPGLVLGTLAGITTALLGPQADDVTAGGLFVQVLQLLAETIATILSVAFTTGMANAAWDKGIASFTDGFVAFKRDGSHVLVALVILVALAAIAVYLAPLTFALSLLVLAFFCVYLFPSVVVGGRGGIAALVESGEIAVERALPTVLMIVAIAVIVYVTGAVAEWLGGVPLVGPIVKQLIVQTVIVYAMLVVVGEYRQLRLPRERLPEV